MRSDTRRTFPSYRVGARDGARLQKQFGDQRPLFLGYLQQPEDLDAEHTFRCNSFCKNIDPFKRPLGEACAACAFVANRRAR